MLQSLVLHSTYEFRICYYSAYISKFLLYIGKERGLAAMLLGASINHSIPMYHCPGREQYDSNVWITEYAGQIVWLYTNVPECECSNSLPVEKRISFSGSV